MAFMEPNYSNETFVRIENKYGESIFVIQSYEDLGADETIVETYKGKWFYQLSAPGYMDQTDWSGPYDTEDEAREALSQEFDCDPDTGDDLTDEGEGEEESESD